MSKASERRVTLSKKTKHTHTHSKNTGNKAVNFSLCVYSSIAYLHFRTCVTYIKSAV